MQPFGERYAAAITDNRPLCHIGIVHSGAMIAACGIVGRMQAGHTNDSYADFNPKSPEPFDPAPNIPILVDNSVHSGATLAEATGYLHRKLFIRPETLVTLFDYGDAQERAMRQWAADELGLRVMSLFNHADLTES